MTIERGVPGAPELPAHKRLERAVRAVVGQSRFARVRFEEWLTLRTAGLTECCPDENCWRALREIRAAFHSEKGGAG
jgi:hypothetical protein